ncbi:immunity 50 family protein [Caballeronia sp. LZ025]|uniref:immunity 50 family protein n=1 Tax=Caballeronia TaxID=1827195 RepID=UPI001FD021CC|nr:MULTISPECIES: immunity 50 family protein [Caballeronia]MDR5731644.1 immunity 50 family protein [Caballeronia sp. LZ025]
MSNANKTWGWHHAKSAEWLKAVLGGYSSFHDSAVRSFCLRRIRQTHEDVNGILLTGNRVRELLDLRLEVLHNRYGAPPVSDRPDYIVVLDFLDIRTSDIDVNGMIEEATIMEMTLSGMPGELIQLDLTPNIGLDIRLTCKEVVVVDMRPYKRDIS